MLRGSVECRAKREQVPVPCSRLNRGQAPVRSKRKEHKLPGSCDPVLLFVKRSVSVGFKRKNDANNRGSFLNFCEKLTAILVSDLFHN